MPIRRTSGDLSKAIKRAAINTKGAPGPSGVDAHCWRRMCMSFKKASDSLCHALPLTARRLCTRYVDPANVAPLMPSPSDSCLIYPIKITE